MQNHHPDTRPSGWQPLQVSVKRIRRNCSCNPYRSFYVRTLAGGILLHTRPAPNTSRWLVLSWSARKTALWNSKFMNARCAAPTILKPWMSSVMRQEDEAFEAYRDARHEEGMWMSFIPIKKSSKYRNACNYLGCNEFRCDIDSVVTTWKVLNHGLGRIMVEGLITEMCFTTKADKVTVAHDLSDNTDSTQRCT